MLIRTERDLAGRSTGTEWHPDRWEYFEDGRMVRMGTDLDGDGNVDRWDRQADDESAPGAGEDAEGADAEGADAEDADSEDSAQGSGDAPDADG